MLSLSSESFRCLHIPQIQKEEYVRVQSTFVSPSVLTDVSKEGPGNKASTEVCRQRCEQTDVSKAAPFNN